jgi:hypothetical protein
MRENRQSGSEGGGSEANRFSLPLYQAAEPQDKAYGAAHVQILMPFLLTCGYRHTSIVVFALVTYSGSNKTLNPGMFISPGPPILSPSK